MPDYKHRPAYNIVCSNHKHGNCVNILEVRGPQVNQNPYILSTFLLPIYKSDFTTCRASQWHLANVLLVNRNCFLFKRNICMYNLDRKYVKLRK
jgi:hypothetical protein